MSAPREVLSHAVADLLAVEVCGTSSDAFRAALLEVRRVWAAGLETFPKPCSGTPDMVNHPPHYTAGGIECIDALRAALGDEAFVAYCRATAIKYLWRTGLKWDAEQDLRKAAWYATRAADTITEIAARRQEQG